MEREEGAYIIEGVIDVNVPAQLAYKQWREFEGFPRFMWGVESVQETGEGIHWVANVQGNRREWIAQIIEQIHNQHIAWYSNEWDFGTQVSFDQIESNRTRVTFRASGGHGARASGGHGAGGGWPQAFSWVLAASLESFKGHVESLGYELGA
jgi:uncharacterized membrane protein